MSGSVHPRWRSYKGHKYLTHFVKFKGQHYYRHYRNYVNYINKYHRPFFTEISVMTHELNKAIIWEFFRYVPLQGISKFNVVDILKFILNWAYDNELIERVPPFPPRKAYKIIRKKPVWLPSERQKRLIDAMPPEDCPIFIFWSLHPVRGAECRQLLKEDYDEQKDVFRIQWI